MPPFRADEVRRARLLSHPAQHCTQDARAWLLRGGGAQDHPTQPTNVAHLYLRYLELDKGRGKHKNRTTASLITLVIRAMGLTFGMVVAAMAFFPVVHDIYFLKTSTFSA